MVPIVMNTNSSSLQPSLVLEQIHIGVVIAVSVSVFLIFAFVYMQLLLILWYGYKLVSYQTVFLFNISMWSAVRLTLYSFYFFNCCRLVNTLPPAANWFLVSFPSILVFVSLALIVYYFMEHLIKMRDKQNFHGKNCTKAMFCLRYIGTAMWIVSVVLFITIDVVFGVFVEVYTRPLESSSFQSDTTVFFILQISKVVILESLILLMGLALGVLIIIIYTTKVRKLIIGFKEVPRKQACLISASLIILFSSRAIYNIVTVCAQSSHFHPFGYSKTFTSDMADFDSHSKENDIVYFSVVLLWEVIPVLLLVGFFRVCNVCCLIESNPVPKSNVNSPIKRRRHFISSFPKSSYVIIPSTGRILHNNPQCSLKRCSSVNKEYGSSSSTYCINGNSQPYTCMPGTTPPQLFMSSPSFISETDNLVS